MWLFITNSAVNKTYKAKENFSDNHFHNILRLFDVLPNFPFTASETMRDFYLWTWYIRFVSRVAERLKTLRNYEISGKCLNFMEW